MEMTVHGETVFAATGGRAWVAGQPMVMLEGMHYGLNCLVSDQIIDRPNLVKSAKYGDIEDWFNGVISIIENPSDSGQIRAALSQNRIDNINQQWHKIYDSFND